VDEADSSFSVHRTLLAAGIPILEGLVNLPALIGVTKNGGKALLAAFPLRIQGLEGSPVRAVALVG
jgi:kynurenine formamidase